ncbi:unnamed protein product [Parascedosporium putredinis]|uniref:Uncharacterized protein n=1 Tax=Parascedosporium putredinis TaxID=1442378 RepID=A0A9P1MAY0_9PEZI|nr:unnamed protein product [Parascedosporium putredinis]CAI7995204.1 unnamed protein product [Parascedosporium putredinis]
MTATSGAPTTPPSAVMAPPKQAPMDATPPSGARTSSIVSQQPMSEPRPEMSRLRGGGMSLGFDCCGGSCRFHKACC